MVDDMARGSLPNASVWPGNAGEFEDVERRVLERKHHNVFYSVKEIALGADVTREAFCNYDPNAAKQFASFPV
jgi:hypothetical protein